MDLLTPASTWAVLDTSNAVDSTTFASSDKAADHDDGGSMPLLQQMVMFVCIVGPLAGLGGAIALLWRGGAIGWPEIWAMIVMYSLCGFGVTIGFHRLLTHRSFDTYPVIRHLTAILGSIAGQGMAIRWIATHRRHHQRSDRDGDPHSPHLHGEGIRGRLRGMWHAHVAWCFDPDADGMARSIPDLLADKRLLLIDRLYFLWVGLGILAPAVALGLYHGTWTGFFSGMIWGGLLRIALLQHVTWAINSICHVWGTRPFRTGDRSTNNLPLAILALGEGWHNNHHAFPTSARHGLRWWQIDLSYIIIRAMAAIGLAWDIRLPTPAAMDARRVH